MLKRLHYWVRFFHDGKVVYGIVDSIGRRASELAAKGQLLVFDAVLPKHWVVDEKYVSDIPMNSNFPGTYIEQERQKAFELSDTIDGCRKGKVMTFIVDDGVAYYVIVKVTKTLVHLEWRGYDPNLNRYVEPVLGYYGKISRDRAEALVQTEQDYQKRFSRRRHVSDR